jgi:hypothetical protein
MYSYVALPGPTYRENLHVNHTGIRCCAKAFIFQLWKDRPCGFDSHPPAPLLVVSRWPTLAEASNLHTRWFPRYGFGQRDLCIDFLKAVEPVSGSGTMLAIPHLTFELKAVSQSESAMPVAPRIGVYRIDILGKVSHRRS